MSVQNTKARTPGPYRVECGVTSARTGRRSWQIVENGTPDDPRPRVVATFTSAQRDEADKMCFACNAHDELVAALSKFTHNPPEHLSPEWFALCDEASAALAKVGET